MKHILNAIVTRLQEKVPALYSVGENWGQLEQEQPAVKFPCALISFEGAQWENLGQHAQGGYATLRIVVACMPLFKDTTLDIFDVMHSVYQALQGWCPDGERAGRLMRTATTLVRRNDGIRQYEMTCLMQFTEEPAQANTTPTIVQPKIIKR
jgi:hypothetical protein